MDLHVSLYARIQMMGMHFIFDYNDSVIIVAKLWVCLDNVKGKFSCPISPKDIEDIGLFNYAILQKTLTFGISKFSLGFKECAFLFDAHTISEKKQLWS